MPDLDERADRIGTALDEVLTAVQEVTGDVRTEHREEIQRVEGTVEFARMCLSYADAESISAGAEKAIREAAEPIAIDADAAVRTRRCGDVLIDAVQLLPDRAVFEAKREVSREEAAQGHDQLRGASWRWAPFREDVSGWHLHCQFCHNISFSENPDYGWLREGWTRIGAPGEPDSQYEYWLCPECFELCRDQFGWTVEEQES